jgi:hypothetical protein
VPHGAHGDRPTGPLSDPGGWIIPIPRPLAPLIAQLVVRRGFGVRNCRALAGGAGGVLVLAITGYCLVFCSVGYSARCSLLAARTQSRTRALLAAHGEGGGRRSLLRELELRVAVDSGSKQPKQRDLGSWYWPWSWVCCQLLPAASYKLQGLGKSASASVLDGCRRAQLAAMGGANNHQAPGSCRGDTPRFRLFFLV